MTEPWAPINPPTIDPQSQPMASVSGTPSSRKLVLAGFGTALAAALLAWLLWSVAADNSPVFTTGENGEVIPADPDTDGGSGSGGGSDDDSGGSADESDEEPEDASGGIVGEDDPSETAEFDALIEELSAFVEAERELEFLEPVEVLQLDDDAFVDRYNALIDESVEEDREELDLFTGINQALGILPPGVTLLDATYAFGSAGVFGYYNPEDKELVVRGGEITVLLKTIIVHELVHAIDDQHFDLYRPEYDDRDDEISTGFSAIVEGNARRVENAWKDTLSADELAQLAADELQASLSMDLDFSKITFEYINLQLAPYEFGEVLVGVLDDEGGEDRINEALEEPPTTSEQVLRPERFVDLDPLESVSPPPADGDVVEQGVFGPLVFQTIFESTSGDDAKRALDGWEGDWFVVWEDGDNTCIRVDVLLEDSADIDELVDVMEKWTDSRGDRASAEKTSDDLARMTACTGR